MPTNYFPDSLMNIEQNNSSFFDSSIFGKQDIADQLELDDQEAYDRLNEMNLYTQAAAPMYTLWGKDPTDEDIERDKRHGYSSGGSWSAGGKGAMSGASKLGRWWPGWGHAVGAVVGGADGKLGLGLGLGSEAGAGLTGDWSREILGDKWGWKFSHALQPGFGGSLESSIGKGVGMGQSFFS